MKLYGIGTCDTCRKAMAALRRAGHDPRLHDVRKTPLGASDLARFHQEFGDRLINRRSATWRGLGTEERAEAPLDLLRRYPVLMKRPLIEDAGKLYLGWDEGVRAALLGP